MSSYQIKTTILHFYILENTIVTMVLITTVKPVLSGPRIKWTPA